MIECRSIPDSHLARAFPVLIESLEMLYLSVLSMSLSRNRFPLSGDMLQFKEIRRDLLFPFRQIIRCVSVRHGRHDIEFHRGNRTGVERMGDTPWHRSGYIPADHPRCSG